MHYTESINKNVQMTLTGIFLLLFSLFFCSCSTRVDYSVKGEFRYYNRTTDTIQVYLRGGINKAFESHTIAVGDSISIHTHEIGPKEANVTNYIPGITADTTTIQFNDTICYTEYNKRGAILHNTGKYMHLKKGNNNYIFYFSIDSSLYNLATKCQ